MSAPVEIPDGPHVLKPGEYGKWAHDGNWYFCCPGGDGHLLANLTNHTIAEHEDGTISVLPSILCTGGRQGARVEWHGYLERGIAREC